MFIIRRATADDAPTLLKLAKMVHFINLPADIELIRGKIARSRKSFAGQVTDPREREFMFVLEDTKTGNVVGTSAIVSCMGYPGRPHTYMELRKREFYSNDLQTGQVHLTLKLGADESGLSELGGLVLGPSYRGHELKLGMFLSLIRFHFMGCCRDWFSDRIVAEMMGPMTPQSTNLFWEYFGRRFINLRFAEADLFCQVSKEFITSLIPREEIYVSLLPPAARNVIGKVGPETEPAKKLLLSIGFKDKGHIDPFDGGPYLEAKVDEIELVRTTRKVTLGPPSDAGGETAFVSTHRGDEFRAVRTTCTNSGGTISIPAAAAGVLGVEAGDEVAMTPLPRRASSSGEKKTKSRRSARAAPPEAVS
jgi:arginine N-succinyltransferase